MTAMFTKKIINNAKKIRRKKNICEGLYRLKSAQKLKRNINSTIINLINLISLPAVITRLSGILYSECSD